MLDAALVGRGMGEFNATTHSGGGGGGRADDMAYEIESEIMEGEICEGRKRGKMTGHGQVEVVTSAELPPVDSALASILNPQFSFLPRLHSQLLFQVSSILHCFLFIMFN